MDIYFKRCQTYKPYPDNDTIDTDIVYFSKSKNHFEKDIIIGMNPIFSTTERKYKLSRLLGCDARKINLLTINGKKT